MENSLKEQTLQHQTATIEITEARTPFSELDENMRLALRCAEEKKAVRTVVLDLRDIASFTEYFIITSGTNQRQVQAIADEIQEQLKKQLDERPVRTEGYATAEWILMDYGDFIIHIFEQKAREFYDLERLWRDAKKVELPAQI
jgi:iojap-like ribosome-associated protein